MSLIFAAGWVRLVKEIKKASYWFGSKFTSGLEKVVKICIEIKLSFFLNSSAIKIFKCAGSIELNKLFLFSKAEILFLKLFEFFLFSLQNFPLIKLYHLCFCYYIITYCYISIFHYILLDNVLLSLYIAVYKSATVFSEGVY